MNAGDAGGAPTFTIVTPAYRGARFLPALHERLQALSADSPPFEWIVVDDASQDDGATVAAMKRIEASSPLAVRCVYLERNRYGAESAKTASRLARGAWTIILDQDDWLAPDALTTFQRGIERFGDRTDFAGVCGRCVDLDGRFIGTRIPGGELYATEFEMRHLHRIRGEMLQCTRTDLVREHFATMEPGFTNGWVWTRIARTHRYLYVDDVVRHYDTGNPESWLHVGRRRIRYPAAQHRETQAYLEHAIRHLARDPLPLLRQVVHCRRFAYLARRCGDRAEPPRAALLRATALAVSPLSFALATRDAWAGRVSCDD